ncbi:unnamed protein product [Meloidogyne enterolobii]|uniref:Uncharacterized protein n=1 Tax=Meloidogyne enterolobii TaxID=390850 RepID=A0ACB0YMZ6_MELEN
MSKQQQKYLPALKEINNFKRKLKEEKEQEINSIQRSHENVLKKYKNDLFSCRKQLKETQDKLADAFWGDNENIMEINKNGSDKACCSNVGSKVDAPTQTDCEKKKKRSRGKHLGRRERNSNKFMNGKKDGQGKK